MTECGSDDDSCAGFAGIVRSECGKLHLYAPAYRYGHQMGSSEHFRDRNWDEAETDLRQDWQATKPASAWDKVKAAIRHGWERIRS
jgi:hypothetical protein